MKKNNKRKPLISALEPRILFDGAAVTTAVDVLDNTSFTDTTTTPDATVDSTPPPLSITSGDIFIITNDLADYETTAANLSENFKVIVLDESTSDLQAQILDATKDLDSELNVHIIAANQSQDKILAGSYDSVNDLINSFDTQDSKIYDLNELIEQDLTPSGENQVIILDESISYSQDILDSIPADWKVITINSQSDGLTQILEALDGISNLSTIHLLSHGNAGEIIIGNLTLDSQTIINRTSDLQKLGEHLSATGDILLYGCDVADGYIGREFLDLLANATSADIAASDDATGTYITNSDFDLEETTGNIESTSITVDTNGQVLGSVETYSINIGLNSSRLYYQASGTSGTGLFTSDNTTWVDQYTNDKKVYYDKIKWVKRGWWIFSWMEPRIYTVSYNYGSGVRYSADQFTLKSDSEYSITASMTTELENYLGSVDRSSFAFPNYALYKGSFDKNNPLENLVTASDGSNTWMSGYVYKGELEAGTYILVTSFDSWVWWPDSKNWMNLNNYAEQMYGSGTLRVENLNRAPVIDTINNVTLDGSGNKTTTPLTWANIYDADGDAITMSAFLLNGSSETALPSWLTFNPNSLTFSGNPPANTGTLTIKVKAFDGQEYGYKYFELTFTNDNDQAIVATEIPDQTWEGEGSFSFTIPSDTFTDADPGTDTFTYTAKLSNGDALPSWLTLNSTTGEFTGNPPADYSSLTVVVTANDGSGQVATNTQTDTFILNLKNNNDIPVDSSISKTIDEDSTYTFTLADFGYADADTHATNDTTSGDGRTFKNIRIEELPLYGTLLLNGVAVEVNQVIVVADITSGKLTYTPNANWAGNSSLLNGADTFKWSASDGADYSNIATTTFNVILINDAPILTFSDGATLSIRPNTNDPLGTTKVDAGLSLVDPDRVHTDDTNFDTILGATVTVVDSSNGNFQAGDLLNATASTNITVSYDSTTGTLTLSGAARASEYQEVLRSLEFSSSNTLNDNLREISITLQTVDVGSKNVAVFDGVDDYIETGRASIPMTDDFTVSVWAQIDSNVVDGQYFILSQGTNADNFFISLNKIGDNWTLRLGDNWTLSDSFPDDGKWHQYTVTRSGTIGIVYIDGVQIGTGTMEAVLPGTDMIIGDVYKKNNTENWHDTVHTYWKGGISDIRIYNDIRTQTEILSSLDTANTLTGYEANLVAWYSLDGDFENKAVTSWSLGRDFNALNGDGIDGAWSLGYLDYPTNSATLNYQTFTAYDGENSTYTVGDNGFSSLVDSTRPYSDTVDGSPYFAFNDGYEATSDGLFMAPGVVRVIAGYINPAAIEFTAQVSGVYEVDARFWDGHPSTTNSMSYYEVYKVDASGNLVSIVGSETTITQNSTSQTSSSISNLRQVQLDVGEKLVFAIHKGDAGGIDADEIFTDVNVNLLAVKTTVSSQDYYYNLETGHYLALSQSTANWNDAKTAAESMTLNGESGYLATPIDDTSMKIMRALMFESGDGTSYLGASQSQSSIFTDSAAEGTLDDGWYWSSGPNEGKVFNGTWMSGEPNGENEDIIGLNWSANSIDGFNAAGYNDFSGLDLKQYFIEFGDNPLDIPSDLQTALGGTQTGNALVFVDTNTAYSSKTGHYYKFSTSTTDFDTAQTSAESSTYDSQSGYLARLTDINELDIVRKLSDINNSTGVWVGAQNVTSSDGSIDWKWVDSSGVVSEYDATQYFQTADSRTQLELAGWSRVSYDDFSHGDTGWTGAGANLFNNEESGRFASVQGWIDKTFDLNNKESIITFKFNRYDSWDNEQFQMRLRWGAEDSYVDIYQNFTYNIEITEPITGTAILNGKSVKYTITPIDNFGNNPNSLVSTWTDQSFEVKLELGANFADTLQFYHNSTLDSNTSDESYTIDDFTVWQQNVSAVETFENGVNSGWDDAYNGTSGFESFTNISNPNYGDALWFANWKPQKTYFIDNEATKIEFDFYALDSWDSEHFYTYINDTLTIDFARSLSINYTDTVSGTIDINGKTVSWTVIPNSDYGDWTKTTGTTEPTWKEQSFHVIIDIPEGFDESVELKFATNLNEGVANESAGIDNVKVYSVQKSAYVDANGVLTSSLDNSFINLDNYETKQFYDAPNNVLGTDAWGDYYGGIATDGTHLYIAYAGNEILVTDMDGVFIERHNFSHNHTSSLTYAEGYLYFRDSNNTAGATDDVVKRISTSDWSVSNVSIDSSHPLLTGDAWLYGNMFSMPDGRVGILSNDITSTTRTVRFYDISSDGLTFTWNSDITLNDTWSWVDDLHGITSDGNYIYIMDYQNNYQSQYKVYDISTGNPVDHGTSLTNIGSFNPTHFTYDPVGDRIYWLDYLGSHFGRSISPTSGYDDRASVIEYGTEGVKSTAPLFTTLTSSLPDKYVTQTKDVVVRVGNTAGTLSDWSKTFDEDSTYELSANDFKNSFTDPEYDSISTVKITTLPDSTKGVLKLDGVDVSLNDVIVFGDLAKLTFVPLSNENGSTTFTYTVNDGNLDSTNSSTVTLNITAKNDAPVLDISNDVTMTAIDEDILDGSNTGMTIADIIVDNSITDADGTAIEAMAITSVNNTNGVWQYSTNSGTSWTNVSNVSGAIINLGSSALLLDNTSLLRFVPNTDYNGSSTFSFRAWDKSSSELVGDTTDPFKVGGNSIVSAEVETVSLTINSINDAPTTQDKTITMDEDTSYTFSLSDFAFVDTKDSGDSLETVVLVTLPTTGTLKLNGTTISAIQSITKADIEAGKLTFTPVADAFGTSYDSFTFKVNDGDDSSVSASTITFDVTDINDAPTAISWQSGGSVAEDAISTSTTPSVVGQLTATDPNGGDTLRFEQLSNNKFVVKPDGTVQLAISSKDQNNADIALLDYELNATEIIRVKVIDSQGLSYELDMTVNVTDVLENTPTLYTNTFYVEKGATVTITEANLNTIDSDTLDRDLTYTVTQFPSGGTFFIDNDSDGVYDEGIDYLLAPADDSMPEHVENFTHADVVAGKLKFIKDSTQTAGKLSLSVTDQTTTKEGVLIGITSTPPEVAAAIDDQEWKTSGEQNFTVPASTFYDADQDILTLSATLADDSALPSWLTFDTTTKTFIGTPTGYSDGQSISIKVTATDGRTTPVTDTFVITFKDIITKPVIDNPLPSYIEFDGSGDKSYQIPADTFSDPLSGTLTYTATLGDGSSLPSWLSFDSTTRTFSGNPPGDTEYGPTVLKITATNDASTPSSTSTTIKLYVSNPNDIPTVNILSDQTISGTSEQTFTINNSDFSDADNDNISLTLITADGSDLPSWITYEVDANGNLVVKATSPGSGSIDLIALGSDGNGGDAQGAFTLNYSGGVNQAPQVATADGIYYMDGSTLEVNTNSKLESFTIIQGKTSTITTDYLDERDNDDDGVDLTYTITTASTKGQLELWEDTSGNGKADTLVRVLGANDTFTAKDLKDGLIQYKHTASDFTNDSFVFNLADNDGATVTGVTFDITVNEAPPVPQLIDIVIYTPNDELTNSDTVSFKLKFSESVFGLSSDDLNITGSLSGTNVSISDITAAGAGEYIVTLSGTDIVNANGTLGIELKSDATIFSGSTRTTLDPSLAPNSSETYTLDNVAPTTTFSRVSETEIIINFNEALSNELLESEISVSNATIASFTRISDKSYKVTLSNISTLTDPIITVNADSVQDSAQNYNIQSTYTVKGSIDISSDDDWIPILVGDNYDPNDDVQSNKAGTDIVGNSTNPLLYTQYNGSELAFRIRQEDAANTSGIFYLMGIDGNSDGKLDFFIGIDMPNNSRQTPVVQFFDAGNGANDAPNTTSFNVSTATQATGTEVNIKVTGGDLDSNANDGFISFKFNAAAFETYVNNLIYEGASTYTVASQLSFVLVTATQTNSINGDIGGIDGNTNEPWSNILTPIVFNNTAPTSDNATINFDESTEYVFSQSNFSFSDADGDSLDSIIITSLPAKGDFLYNNAGTWEYVTLNQEISAADITAGKLKYAPIDNENGTSYDGFNFKVSDGKSNSAEDYTITLDVNSVNSIPVIDNLDGEVTYWSNANEPVSIDPFTYAVVSDADNLDFNGGVLTVTISGGALSENQLTLVNNGNITISGNNISYNGTVIGTIDTTSNGVNGSDLIVTFNSDATQSKITELIAALKFTYTGTALVSDIRTLTMKISDGDGAESTVSTVKLVGPPVYNTNGYEDTTLNFNGDDFNIDTNDNIKVTILSENKGTWYYLDASNSNAKTLLVVSDVLTSTEFDTLTYEPNSDVYGDGIDSLNFKYIGTANSSGFDANGYSYSQPTIIVNLAPVNDGATIDLNGSYGTGVNTTATYTEMNGADNSSNDIKLTNGHVSISDVDGSTLESLTISSNSFDGDELIIGSTKLDLRQNTSGTVTVNGVTFNYSVNSGTANSIVKFSASSTDSSSYEDLLNSITFNNSSDTPNETQRVFNISANDGQTQGSEVTAIINVVAVNDTPILNDVNLSNQYDWALDKAVTLAPSATLSDLDGTVEQVTLTINSANAGDILNFTDAGNVTGNYVGGVLTLTNTGTSADMQAALRTVTFSSTDDTDGTRYIDIVATDDGSANTNIATTKVDLVHNTPEIDLDDASDTGNSNNDNVTSDDTPTFTITLPTIYTNGSTLNLYDSNGYIIGTATVNIGDTTATVTVSQRPNGLQTIITKVIDSSGDTSKDSNEAELEIYVDKTAPSFENQEFTYAENSTTSDILANVVASDAGDIVNYTISSGNTSGYFTIDSDGNITLTSTGAGAVASNNYETLSNSFALGVQVTDSAGNTITKTVTMNVSNVDESNPTFNTTSYNYTENQNANSVVVTLDADDDIGITSYTLNSVIDGGSNNLTSSNYFTIDNDGRIAITLAGAKALTNDFETTPNIFTLNISASDLAGKTTTQNITLNVTDINDAPILNPIVEGYVVDNTTGAHTKTDLSGTLTSSDQDSGATATYSIVDGTSTVQTLVGTYGTLTLNSSTGAYTYTVDDAKVEKLSDSDNLSEAFNLKVSDGSLSDTKTFVINIKGANDAPTLDIVSSIEIVENPNDPTGSPVDNTQDISLSGNVTFNDVDNTSDTVSVSFALNSAPVWSNTTADQTSFNAIKDTLDAFSVTTVTNESTLPNSTPWSYNITGVDLTFLNAGETITFSYNVTATDSNSATSTKTITFTIHGQASTPIISSLNSEGNVVEAGDGDTGTNSITKTLNAVDLDIGTVFTWSGDTAGTYGSFAIDASTGEWTYTLDNSNSATQALQTGDNVTETFTVTVSDNTPTTPKTDTQVVTINIKGTNDAPVLTTPTAIDYQDTNGNDTFTTETGTLSSSDVDADDTKVYSIASQVSDLTQFGYTHSLNGTYGKLYFNSATGAYKYVSDDSKIEAATSNDTDTFSFVVTDSKGSTDTENLIVNILGRNDSSIITANDNSANIDETNSVLSAIGDFTVTDIDISDTVTASVLNTSTIKLNSDSATTMTSTQLGWLSFVEAAVLDNTETTNSLIWKFNSGTEFFDDLSAGDTLTLTYNIQVTDETTPVTQTVTVVINGTNDAPTLSILAGDKSTGDIVENNNTNRTATGTVTLGEKELRDTLTASINSVKVNPNSTAPSAAIPTNAQILAMMSLDKSTLLNDTSTANEKLAWNFNSGSFDFDGLAKGETLILDYNLQVSDGTDTLNDTIKITIIGTDDSRELTAVDVSGGIESGKPEKLTSTGAITFTDVDISDRVTLSESLKTISGTKKDTSSLTISSAQQTAIENAFSVINTTGNTNDGTIGWDFTITQGEIDFLGSGESITAVFTIEVTNLSGQIDTQDVTITLAGQNKAPVISAGPGVSNLTETDSSLSDTITLTATDENITDKVVAEVISGTVQRTGGNSEAMSLTQLSWLTLADLNILNSTESTNNMPWEFNSGSYTFDDLSSNETLTLVYTVKISDDAPISANDTETITITIQGTNDAPNILENAYISSIEETNNPLVVFGKFTIKDLDILNEVTLSKALSVSGTSNRSDSSAPSNSDLEGMLIIPSTPIISNSLTQEILNWEFNSNSEIFDYLHEGDTLILEYTITATDNNGTPASDSQTITLTIVGTNDNPEIIIASDINYEELIDASNTTIDKSGIINITDKDTADIVDITVTSNNDIIWSGGTINSTLANSLVNGFSIVETNTSSLTTPSNLTWKYNPSNINLDFLAKNETITFSYTVDASDAQSGLSSKDITITITGTNDTPEIQIVDVSGSIVEGTTLSDNGSIKFTDVDLTDRAQATQATKSISALAQNGTNVLVLTTTQQQNIEDAFTINNTSTNTNNGEVTWDYTITEDKLDFLGQGETVTAVFTITVTDDEGSTATQDVTITITGTNDTPEIQIVDVSGSIVEGTTLSDDGSIKFTDVDLTDRAQATQATRSISALAQNGTNVLVLTTTQQQNIEDAFTINNTSTNTNNGEVTWDYTITEDKLDFLGQGETVTAVFTITVTDDEGSTATQDVTITITGTNDNPTVNTSSNLYVQIGFGEQLEANNLKNHFGFADKDLTDKFKFELINGPKGIIIDPNTGVMSGKPSQSGNFTITVKVMDDEGAFVTKDFEMLVVAPPQNEAPVENNTSSINETAQEIVKEITVDRIDSMINSFTDTPDNTDTQNTDDGLAGLLNGQNGIDGKSNNNDGLDIAKTELTTITSNTNNNPNGKLVSASLSVDIDNTGKVNVNDKSSKAFETVGLSIEKMDFTNDQIEIKILDTRVGQKYIVTLSNGNDLPPSLSFDPNTGIVKGTLPAGMEELALSIKALSSDGTTRILNIKIDMNQLKEKVKDSAKEAKFETLREQIEAQNDSMNNYGSKIAALFNNFAS